MKLIVLAAVVSISVFRASCRERPEGRDLNDVDRNLADSTKLPEYSDFSDGDDLYYITDLPAGPKDEATTIEPDAFSSEPVDRVSTTDVDMAFPTIEFGPELVQAGFQNNNSSDIDYQWREDETGQNERKLRVNLEANSKRKENNKLTKAVSVMKKDLKTIKKNIDSIRKHQGCPEGLFLFTPSNQCFRFLQDRRHNWDSANTACKNLGLQLAQPFDPISIQHYIITKYGNVPHTWIGGRGDGRNMKWLRTGKDITRDNPLWRPGAPGGVSTGHCLALVTQESNWKSDPNQPYHSHGCSAGWYTLCEFVV